MTEFQFWQEAYTQGWSTQQDVHDAATLGIITADEYETIVGTPYVV